jgi:hypothetical protein
VLKMKYIRQTLKTLTTLLQGGIGHAGLSLEHSEFQSLLVYDIQIISQSSSRSGLAQAKYISLNHQNTHAQIQLKFSNNVCFECAVNFFDPYLTRSWTFSLCASILPMEFCLYKICFRVGYA